MFTALPSSESGITFNNTINEAKMPGEALNEFAYMGGGVGIIDINNDGLKDIFFCGNQVSSKLYMNKGNNHFEDITQQAGVATNTWATGVSVADINNDGYEDMYVCTYGKNLSVRTANLLFINQHNNTFKEEAAAYGLADTSYSTQAVFFDYDKDGDLDMFLVNYLLNASYSANYILPKNLSGRSPANDKLYRNDGDAKGGRHPTFTDVSMAAGIKEDGYGLGVTVSDFNNDGWPDMYIANDFVSNDELWLNNKNGTFTNTLDLSTKHQSYSSMGCDAADINNDSLIDFATLDMMPEDNTRKKLTFSFMNYDRYEAERNLGYSPEFARNMLQLNNGTYTASDTIIPFFSEIGQLAGISETDWSWSVLLADFNNDGYKDIHITNGIGRDFINADFVQFNQNLGNSTSNMEEAKRLMKEKLVSLKHVALPNYLYLNNGNYTFTDISDSAGINESSISNGAAYADLDNDGDLDMVVNNINKEAFVFINHTIEKNKPLTNHSISFMLQGDSLNKDGFGAKVYVYAGGKAQVQEAFPVRGYLSSVDKKLLFGTGKNAMPDSVIVVWSNNLQQVIRQVKADSVYTLYQRNAMQPQPVTPKPANLLFTSATTAANIQYKHTDVSYYDYGNQRLLPQKFSQLGPFISTGDINKDGATDFYIGGAFNFSGQLFTQQGNGTFAAKKLTDSIKMQEDEGSILFDADGDDDLDLLVTYGDMRYADTSVYYKPRLYLNDGKGNYSFNPHAIPDAVRTIAGCITAGDYDGDGDEDIFIGGRVSKKYPLSPHSYILQNNKGIFTNVTSSVCPALQQAGMITAATWADFDNDKRPDLVIAGEYMPVRFFKNVGAKLTEVTDKSSLQNMDGMWRSLMATDIDKDGDIDFVAGNLGLNNHYHITPQYPMQLYAKDIDNNGSIDPVLFYYIKNEEGKRALFPSLSRDQLAEQVPGVKKAFLLNKDYAAATVDNLFNDKKDLQTYTCTEARSCWIENTGNGKFVMHALPIEAQFAPVNAIVCTDADGDGINDLLLAGNEYQTEVMTGRYDASYGCFLKGNKDKTFTYVPPAQSGFIINGDVKDMKMIINAKNEKMVLVAVNNDYLQVFKINVK
ncbi:VCBS repeat-containing protein [Ilyomonas limi]|nr:VCBS repeat-containing protein [Ilyomonas limi]